MGHRMKVYKVVKADPHHKGEGYADDYEFPYEHNAEMLMTSKGYIDYVKKHGYHFTDALAEHVSKMMVNANGAEHSWTANQVAKAMEGLSLSIPEGVTLGDVTYQANMGYADLFPEVLKDEPSCLKYAHKIAHDPDGYKGMIFCRWTSDVIGKGLHIDWPKFV